MSQELVHQDPRPYSSFSTPQGFVIWPARSHLVKNLKAASRDEASTISVVGGGWP